MDLEDVVERHVARLISYWMRIDLRNLSDSNDAPWAHLYLFGFSRLDKRNSPLLSVAFEVSLPAFESPGGSR